MLTKSRRISDGFEYYTLQKSKITASEKESRTASRLGNCPSTTHDILSWVRPLLVLLMLEQEIIVSSCRVAWCNVLQLITQFQSGPFDHSWVHFES